MLGTSVVVDGKAMTCYLADYASETYFVTTSRNATEGTFYMTCGNPRNPICTCPAGRTRGSRERCRRGFCVHVEATHRVALLQAGEEARLRGVLEAELEQAPELERGPAPPPDFDLEALRAGFAQLGKVRR
jgi:hypothetical protein